MLKIEQEDRDLLDELLVEATDGNDQTVEQWQAAFLETAHQLLVKQPLRYRGYGPYWWLLKGALVAAGYRYDQETDSEWVASLSTDSVPLDLVACWLYQQETFSQGLHMSPHHQLPLPNGETAGFVAGDERQEFKELMRHSA